MKNGTKMRESALCCFHKPLGQTTFFSRICKYIFAFGLAGSAFAIRLKRQILDGGKPSFVGQKWCERDAR